MKKFTKTCVQTYTLKEIQICNFLIVSAGSLSATLCTHYHLCTLKVVPPLVVSANSHICYQLSLLPIVLQLIPVVYAISWSATVCLLPVVVPLPVVPVPVVLQPVVLQPVVLQPVVLQPVVLQPVVLQPVVLQPVVLQPVVLQPVVPQPVVLQPVVLLLVVGAIPCAAINLMWTLC